MRDMTREGGECAYSLQISEICSPVTLAWLKFSVLDVGGFSMVPCVVEYTTPSSQRAHTMNVSCHPRYFRPPRKEMTFSCELEEKLRHSLVGKGLFVDLFEQSLEA